MSGTGEALIGKHEYQTNKRYQYKKTCYFCGETEWTFFKDCPKSLGADPRGSLGSRDPPPKIYQGSQKNDVLYKNTLKCIIS